MDGDGQHNPAKIPSFLREIRKGKDIVFGYRRLDKTIYMM